MGAEEKFYRGRPGEREIPGQPPGEYGPVTVLAWEVAQMLRLVEELEWIRRPAQALELGGGANKKRNELSGHARRAGDANRKRNDIPGLETNIAGLAAPQ